MRTSFGCIFWGLIFNLINISINGFDLLPNGIGYLLIAWGASQLVAQSAKFATASALSTVLILVWLVRFAGDIEAVWAHYIVSVILNVTMYWFLLGGIIDFAMARERTDLAERAANRRIYYAAIMAISVLLPAIAPVAPLVIILVIAGVVVSIMILHLVYRVRYELA